MDATLNLDNLLCELSMDANQNPSKIGFDMHLKAQGFRNFKCSLDGLGSIKIYIPNTYMLVATYI